MPNRAASVVVAGNEQPHQSRATPILGRPAGTPPAGGTTSSGAAARCRQTGRAQCDPRNGPATEPAAANTLGAEQTASSAIMPPLEKPTTYTRFGSTGTVASTA